MKRLKPKSEFNRNVLTLMTGTTIAQAIPIAISPILTRIYTPEDFGVYAIFMALLLIFGSIANGRYELVIMLPKKDEDAINIFALGFIITIAISLLLLILVVLFNDYLTNLLGHDDISFWLYFIPIAVFFTGFFNILNYFNNRKKNYRYMARASIIKAIILSIIQILVGFVNQGASGLIGGQILSRMFANMQLFKTIIKDKTLLSMIKKEKIIALAKKYSEFPKISLWAMLISTSSTQLVNILISIYYNITTLGFYSLVQRVLGMPSALMGTSISQVFLQQAAEEEQKTGQVIQTFNATFKRLIIIGVPSFIFLYYYIQDIFVIVFGEPWRIAGIYAQILIPLYFIRFLTVTFTVLPLLFNDAKKDLYFQSGLLSLYIIIVFLGNIFNLAFVNILHLFTYIIGFYYIVYLLMLNKMKWGQ